MLISYAGRVVGQPDYAGRQRQAVQQKCRLRCRLQSGIEGDDAGETRSSATKVIRLRNTHHLTRKLSIFHHVLKPRHTDVLNLPRHHSERQELRSKLLGSGTNSYDIRDGLKGDSKPMMAAKGPEPRSIVLLRI